MFKKSFAAMMALVLVFFVAGCGGGGGEQKKAEVEKPQYSADQAVKSYAELYAFGVTTHMAEAGLTDSDVKPIEEKIVGDLVNAFSQFPLSDDNIANITGMYVDKLSSTMNIKTTLKTDDPESPVVTLSARTIDQAAAAAEAAQNEDLLALGMALGALQAEGITIDELKADAEFQTATIDAINKFIEKVPLTAEKSVDITCEKVKGADGKLYWAPKNLNDVINFVQGK